MKLTDKIHEIFTPLTPMTFREYCEERLRRDIDNTEWLERYDHFEERLFADYLIDMAELDYDPECGMDF